MGKRLQHPWKRVGLQAQSLQCGLVGSPRETQLVVARRRTRPRTHSSRSSPMSQCRAPSTGGGAELLAAAGDPLGLWPAPSQNQPCQLALPRKRCALVPTREGETLVALAARPLGTRSGTCVWKVNEASEHSNVCRQAAWQSAHRSTSGHRTLSDCVLVCGSKCSSEL